MVELSAERLQLWYPNGSPGCTGSGGFLAKGVRVRFYAVGGNGKVVIPLFFDESILRNSVNIGFRRELDR